MAYTHLVSTAKESADTNSVTTNAVDTSGADLLVVECAFLSFTSPTFSDSKGNTWNGPLSHDSGTSVSQLFWTKPTSVGSGHTFTLSGTACFPSIAASAFSGSSASPLDQTNGAQGSGGLNNLQTGSVTPGEDNELIVTGIAANTVASNTITIDSGFTIGAQVTSDTNISVAIAYIIETTATAKNPSWDVTPSGTMTDAATEIATFKVSSGGGGPTQTVIICG